MFKYISIRPSMEDTDTVISLLKSLAEGYKIISSTVVDEYIIYILEKHV